MRGHVEAIVGRLEDAGVPAYLVDIPEGVQPTFPYAIVWMSTGEELRDSFTDYAHVDDRLGVTNVGLTPEAVWSLSSRTRAALKGWAPDVGGWHTEPMQLAGAETVQPDRDVTLPNSNRHPYYGVDTYRLVAEPVELEDES